VRYAQIQTRRGWQTASQVKEGQAMITAKQETDRTKGIGSSDVPTILGLSPWSTAYDLWLMKTGQVPGVQENEAMRMGSMLEPAVLSLAAHRLGVRVVKPTSTYIGAEPFMRANIDGMVGIAKRGSDIVEAKTTGRPDGWGEEGTDQVPEMVKAQVMFQMACASSGVAHVACLMGDYGLRLKMYRVSFCSDYAGYIDERIRAFWDCVQTRTAPEGSASLEMLKRVRRDVDAPAVEIDPELFRADIEARKLASYAEEQAGIARAKLLTALGNSMKGEGGGYAVRVSSVETSRFDAKAFADANPEEVSKWMVASGYNRVTVTAPKNGTK
jgi:putative phage-type endonuclease